MENKCSECQAPLADNGSGIMVCSVDAGHVQTEAAAPMDSESSDATTSTEATPAA